MKKPFPVILAILSFAIVLCAQEQGGQTVRGVGTVNQMSATPDQNQRLTGQQPLSNTGGQPADVPDSSDRVNGRAYPVGAAPAAENDPQAVETALDPRNGRPVSDAARLEAARQVQAGAQRPNLDPSRTPETAETPSPGAKAKTKASTGGQTNDTHKQSKQK